MNKEEYKFDHFKNIDEVMYYLNYWYKEEDVYSIDRYLSLKDFNYISNKYQELQRENKRQKEVINKAIEYIETCNPNVELHSEFLDESYLSNYGAKELLDILKEVN